MVEPVFGQWPLRAAKRTYGDPMGSFDVRMIEPPLEAARLSYKRERQGVGLSTA
jgi:hypothetical protein